MHFQEQKPKRKTKLEGLFNQTKGNKDDNKKNEVQRVSQNVDQNHDISQELQNLRKNNSQLKQIIQEEKLNFQKLKHEFEQLEQEKEIMEKQYIALKYQSVKSLGQEIYKTKMNIVEYLQKETKVLIEDFLVNIQEEKLSEIFHKQLQNFLNSIVEISSTIMKEREKERKSTLFYIQSIDKTVGQLKCQSILSPKSVLKMSPVKSSLQINTPTKTRKTYINNQKSPRQQQQNLMVPQDELKCEAKESYVWTDEYYGGIEDYNFLDEKLEKRKNYELLKNISRQSYDNKRKKIFNVSNPI